MYERFGSYTQPFTDLVERPLYLIFGSSINSLRSESQMPYFNYSSQKPDHSLFGRSFYLYGLLTSMAYMIILLKLIKISIYDFYHKKYRFMLIIPIIFWCLFTHGMISSPFGSAMFFLAVSITFSDFKLEKYKEVE